MTDAQQESYGPGPYPTGPYPSAAGQTGYGPYPGAGQPGAGAYPQPPYGYGYPMQPGTNTMAILALVFAFVFSPAAIVLGLLARKEIRRTGEQGLGLATAGLVCGIVFTVLSAIGIGIMIALSVALSHQVQNDQDSIGAALYVARAYFGF